MKYSIVVPAYNEEKRIGNFLPDLKKFTEGEDAEVIVVDDGSKDKTVEVLNGLKWDALKIISYKPNRGKGHAVRTGVEAAKGDYVIFLDADGSTGVSEIPKMGNAFENADVVVGTRKTDDASLEKKQPFGRRLASWGFNTLVNVMFLMNHSDYLCGFKGFKRDAAKNIFSDMKSKRWSFDVEVFYRAKKFKYKVAEVPISWKHMEGSKISLARDMPTIFLSLLKLRFT